MRTDGPSEFRATIETRPTPVSVLGALASRPTAELVEFDELITTAEAERHRAQRLDAAISA